LKFACRQLLKNPGFTAVAVLTLGLGIGTTITVLSIVHDVILAPAPYPNAQRIVLVSANRPDGQPHPRAWSAGHWEVFRRQTKSFDALACYEWAFDFLVMPDGSESIGGMTVSKDYFEFVGVVSNTRTDNLTRPSRSELYFSLWQASAWVKHLIVRTKADPRQLAAEYSS